jgi:hypothetical protein
MSKYDFLLADFDDIPEIVSIYHSNIGTPGCTEQILLNIMKSHRYL